MVQNIPAHPRSVREGEPCLGRRGNGVVTAIFCLIDTARDGCWEFGRQLTANSRKQSSGGEGGIRTLGTGVSPYNGLANRRIRPLCHLSAVRERGTTCIVYHFIRASVFLRRSRRSPAQSQDFKRPY